MEHYFSKTWPFHLALFVCIVVLPILLALRFIGPDSFSMLVYVAVYLPWITAAISLVCTLIFRRIDFFLTASAAACVLLLYFILCLISLSLENPWFLLRYGLIPVFTVLAANLAAGWIFRLTAKKT